MNQSNLGWARSISLVRGVLPYIFFGGLFVQSCEDPAVTNPADPNYELSAPTLLSAEAITDTSIMLTWKNNEEYTRQFVINRKVGSGPYHLIGTVSNEILTFIDSTCDLGIEYSYVVQSKVESNLSNDSNTLIKATSFLAPSNLVASSISDSEILFTWTDNTNYEAGFIIERVAGSGFVELDTLSTDISEYTDTGLIFGQTYVYRVAAYTSANTSTWATITATTEFQAPSDLTASSISDSEILLTWTDNTNYESGFKVERDDGIGFIEIGTVSADLTGYTDTGLIFGQSYLYRVAAYTSVNTSSWVTIEAATEFQAPSDLTASSISDSEIQLTWLDNTDFERGYKIQRDAGIGFDENGATSSNVTEFTDTGLAYGHIYTYRVAAYTFLNTSSWVTIEAATDFPAPTDLTATVVSDSEVLLSWTDNTSFESGFTIERDEGTGFIEIETVSGDVTEYIDAGLIYKQSYDYRISAYTAANTSDYSIIATAVSCGNCVVDYDGNIYEIIQIGDQVWMSENLNVTHYRDGTAIPIVEDAEEWIVLMAGGYCYYGNASSNQDYGALYNWHAVNGDTNGDGLKDKEIAPEGWHVPSDDEWKQLEMHQGISQSEADAEGFRGSNQGSKLAGNAVLWQNEALENNAEFGISGLNLIPGGWRAGDGNGFSYNMAQVAYSWSSSVYDSSQAWMRGINYNDPRIYRDFIDKTTGVSIRLLKD